MQIRNMVQGADSPRFQTLRNTETEDFIHVVAQVADVLQQQSRFTFARVSVIHSANQ